MFSLYSPTGHNSGDTRDRPEPRALTDIERTNLRAITAAAQLVREAVHTMRSVQMLPEGHPALELYDGFETDGRWLISAYLDEAALAIEAGPELECSDEEDVRGEG